MNLVASMRLLESCLPESLVFACAISDPHYHKTSCRRRLDCEGHYRLGRDPLKSGGVNPCCWHEHFQDSRVWTARVPTTYNPYRRQPSFERLRNAAQALLSRPEAACAFASSLAVELWTV